MRLRSHQLQIHTSQHMGGSGMSKAQATKKVWRQDQTKEIGGLSSLKNVKELQSGMQAMELMGLQEESAVEVQSIKHKEMLKEVEALKSSYQIPSEALLHKASACGANLLKLVGQSLGPSVPACIHTPSLLIRRPG